jgi:ABC-type multidrug transport system fused ATPase/permease subunit
MVTALPLAEQKKYIEDFQKTLTMTFSGYAQQVATIRLDSIRGRLTLLKRSWEEWVLAIEDGTGPIGKSLKRYLDVARAMLLISADSDIARDSLLGMRTDITDTAHRYLFWMKVLGWIIGLLIAAKVLITLWSAGIILGKVAVLGFAAAVNVAKFAVFLFNAALAANPIGLIVIGVSLLIAGLLLMIHYWDKWGAGVSLLIGPLGLLLNMIMSISKHWDKITNAFETEGLLAGFKALNDAIVDGLLLSIQQLYIALSKLPGLGDLAKTADFIDKYRNGAFATTTTRLRQGADTSWNESGSKREIVNPRESQEDAFQSYMEHFGKVGIEISNKSGHPVKANAQGIASIVMKPQSTFDY